MGYYAGDYYAGDGLFSRFSFKKLGRFVGKVAKNPLVQMATSLIPGLGGAVSSLATRIAGSGLTKTATQVAGALAPAVGVGYDIWRGLTPGTTAASGVVGAEMGGTPGTVAHAVSHRRLARTRYSRRRRRRSR